MTVSGIYEDGSHWWLAGHWSLTSPLGNYKATFQSDGNLVIHDTKTWKPFWRSGTEARPDRHPEKGHKMTYKTPVSQTGFGQNLQPIPGWPLRSGVIITCMEPTPSNPFHRYVIPHLNFPMSLRTTRNGNPASCPSIMLGAGSCGTPLAPTRMECVKIYIMAFLPISPSQ